MMKNYLNVPFEMHVDTRTCWQIATNHGLIDIPILRTQKFNGIF